MECRYCKGTGTTNWCINGTFITCPACNGTGIDVPDEEQEEPQEQTNEEWFCTLSTEEKAEVLLRFYYQDVCMNTKQSVVEWLKEVHETTETADN